MDTILLFIALVFFFDAFFEATSKYLSRLLTGSDKGNSKPESKPRYLGEKIEVDGGYREGKKTSWKITYPDGTDHMIEVPKGEEAVMDFLVTCALHTANSDENHEDHDDEEQGRDS